MKKKLLALLLTTLMTVSVLTSCGKSSGAASSGKSSESFAGKTLNLLTWEGYSDKSITKDFEAKYGCKINGTYFTSSDDLVAKLKAGGGSSYDIISPSGDMAGYLVKSDMVDPVDLSVVTNYTDIDSALKLDDVVKDGKTYGVPYLWGPDYLIYDADVVKTEPTSWNVLWDPQYKGKISLYDDVSNIYMIGQMEGLDKTNKASLYNMSESQLVDAKNKLTTLNASVRKYWTTAGELNDLFANREVVLAVGWPLTVKQLKDKGRNLKWCIPREGCTGWEDRLMIVKGSQNEKLANLYLNYAISAKGQALSSNVTYYCVANKDAAKYMSDSLRGLTYVDNMRPFFERINFWQYVPNRSRYNDIWTGVKTSK